MKEDSLRIVEDLRWMLPPDEGGSPSALWIGLAVTAFIVIALTLLILRKRHIAPLHRPAPAPHEGAFRALEGLSALLREGQEREFVTQVSAIVRGYIQDRFGLRAPHRSTEEFLREASGSTVLGAHDQELLRDFLSECDKVKFARRRMALPQMTALREAALRFVRGTIPPPAVKP